MADKPAAGLVGSVLSGSRLSGAEPSGAEPPGAGLLEVELPEAGLLEAGLPGLVLWAIYEQPPAFAFLLEDDWIGLKTPSLYKPQIKRS